MIIPILFILIGVLVLLVGRHEYKHEHDNLLDKISNVLCIALGVMLLIYGIALQTHTLLLSAGGH